MMKVSRCRFGAISVIAPGLIVSGLAVSTFSPLAFAQNSATPAAKLSEPSSGTTTKGSGLVVSIDPKTHKPRQPNPEELQALEAKRTAAAIPARARTELSHPNGAVGVTMDDSSFSSLVVSKSPDGKLKMDCLIGSKAKVASSSDKQRVSANQPIVSKESANVR